MTVNNDVAIKVSGVTKAFKLPHEKQNSIKGTIINMFRTKKSFEKQLVLNDISFEIKKGEFFGIVGRNGSGKSTLLKLISGIYTQDKGNIIINGKLTPFIELGVGFNPELTGRENVFLNGALLGFNRKEIDLMYDEIVEFAELEKFMDQKLKNYSSGMQVRLAFSIAIRANTDILVLDEVLAVGDTNFQRKCFDYFNQLKRDKKTIVLVTHDMSSVERFCNRAILLNDSELIAEGKPSSITKKYSDVNLDLADSRNLKDERKTKSESLSNQLVNLSCILKISDKNVRSINATNTKKINLEISIISKIDVENPVLGLIISNSNGIPIFATNTKQKNTKMPNLKKNTKIFANFEIDNIFANGDYIVSVGIKSFDQTIIYCTYDELFKFTVGGRKHEYAVTSPDYEYKFR